MSFTEFGDKFIYYGLFDSLTNDYFDRPKYRYSPASMTRPPLAGRWASIALLFNILLTYNTHYNYCGVAVLILLHALLLQTTNTY